MSPPLVFLAAAAFAGWAAVGYIAYLHRAPVRNQILPDTLGKVPRVSHAVAGDTAWLTRGTLPSVSGRIWFRTGARCLSLIHI